MTDDIGSGNRRLLDLVTRRQRAVLDDPTAFFPWRRPCTVKTLLVTDGILDFGLGDFGLRTFVDVLINDKRSYVRFDLTVAHLSATVSNAAVLQGVPGISRSIKGFVFDDPDHFTPETYDVVWLFGFDSFIHGVDYPNRTADPARYPATRLGDAELDALTAHANRGGGLFGTGDHGSIGSALCGSVDRLRGQRHWQDFGASEVGMTTARRNDSNRIGHDAGSQFSDQSDDVPQVLDLKLYSTRVGLLKAARYPHPVLCSRLGRIDVFPDHPHEGQVRVPPNLGLSCRDGSPEYPDAAGGGQVVPEIVATGRVPAGNTASSNGGLNLKTPTIAHTFGVVATYDGHRAGVGRVVTDSTWHHFVNVNLIGVVEGGLFDDFVGPGPGPGTPGTHFSKHIGFLASPSGRAALDKIREYYVNVGVWLAPPARIKCMNSRFWWELLWSDRIVEATLQRPDLTLDKVALPELFHIGVHARDVLGRHAGACRTLHWVFPLIVDLQVELRPWIDPWWPGDDRREVDPPLPWLDVQPLVDVAVGGALVALRGAFPHPGTDVDFDDKAREVALKGARTAYERGLERFRGDLKGALRFTLPGEETGVR
ncbi:hypothetical protein GCM10022243_05420 [Saccharothrix violaceirubra]|uniref:Uncharacterized protein n=1 Tax=Saccharothrix violaceirubra TaxID=413306 RepID=A0A7W7SZ04_9PSEU|nr:hypothetical protein [Saccharothrix violaceirubra]MBB4962952.1 hypothetical protein [Saccharothrix violaceirubra]